MTCQLPFHFIQMTTHPYIQNFSSPILFRMSIPEHTAGLTQQCQHSRFFSMGSLTPGLISALVEKPWTPSSDFFMRSDTMVGVRQWRSSCSSSGWHVAPPAGLSAGFSRFRRPLYSALPEVLGSLLHHRCHVIRLPGTEEERRAVGNGFAKLANHVAFQGALGAIDGCHIRIKAPTNDAVCYFNRKLFYSVVLQAVCDHSGTFIDTFCGFPGSAHDARILRCSPLVVSAVYPPATYFLLGDGGYPCIEDPITIITPL